MARIEAQGYQLLQKLGAQQLTAVYSAGGGAKNQVWQEIRQQQLQVPMLVAHQQDAAHGMALIAHRGINYSRW